MNLNFKIVAWNLKNVKYELQVDNETAFETKGDLEEVLKEMKKYMRLRFKESIK
jgi:hypothetical protein